MPELAIEEPQLMVEQPQLKLRRVSLNLPMASYQELEAVATKTTRTMTDIVRFGLALVKLYLEETGKGNKLVIASPEGKSISEIRFPG